MKEKNEGEGIVQLLDWVRKGNRWTVPTILIAIWLSWGFFVYYNRTTISPAHVGQFGDSFGVVNALFSGMAMLGVVYAVWLQHSELSLLKHKMEEEEEVGLISAQPYLRFMSPNSSNNIFDDHVNVCFWNYRAVATGVRCTFPVDGCTIEIFPPDVLLVQPMLHDQNAATGRFTLTFSGRLKDQFKTGHFACRFDLEYRDALGRKQFRKLDFLGEPKGMTIQLADGYTWDSPKREDET